MPCADASHSHHWNTVGELTIERCEKICAFCNKSFKHAWFLRRHVKNVHVKQYPYLEVNEGWSSSPEGNRKSSSPRKPRSRSSSSSSTSTKIKKNINEDLAAHIASFDFNNYIPAGETEPVPINPFECRPIINLSDEEMEALFAMPSIEEAQPTAVTSFVTPQRVRDTGGEIVAVEPEGEHHGTAMVFAEGLNNIVGGVAAIGTMTPEEIVYVLETFTHCYKLGIAMPLQFSES